MRTGIWAGIAIVATAAAGYAAVMRATGPAPADVARGPLGDVIRRCEHRGRVGMAAVAVCPIPLDRDLVAGIGRWACEGARACNAWIWVDPASAPPRRSRPAREMTDAEAQAADAVYFGATGEARMCFADGC